MAKLFTTLNYSLQLVEKDHRTPMSPHSLQRVILDALARQVQKKIHSAKNRVSRGIANILERVIKDSETYQALVSGDQRLRAHLGLANTSVVDTIIDTWKKSVNANYFIFNTGTQALGTGIRNNLFTITVEAIQADFADVLAKTEAEYTSTNSKGQETLIPWLRWLLFEGSKPIIQEFAVKRGDFPDSRSGRAYMVKSTKGWSVPLLGNFTGTVDDNFVTAALEQNESEFIKVFENIFDLILVE